MLHPLVEVVAPWPTAGGAYDQDTCHPIPPGLNRYVVTLSELCRFVSVAPSEVGTLYYFLGVLAIGERSYGHVRVCAANIYLIPGNPHGV